MLIENPLDRFKLGSDTPVLKVRDDDGLTVTLTSKPAADETNWLVTPGGDFHIIFRIYWPGEAVIDGTWLLWRGAQ